MAQVLERAAAAPDPAAALGWPRRLRMVSNRGGGGGGAAGWDQPIACWKDFAVHAAWDKGALHAYLEKGYE